jgi:SAM-dependent methyltransferase
MAAAHSNKNEKTTEQLMAEIRARLEWIGVDFLDDSKDEEDVVEGGKVDGKSVKLLDYGCGTGMVSRVSPLFSYSNPVFAVVSEDADLMLIPMLTSNKQAFAPYITQAVGIDISPNMVHEYNTWSSTQSLTSKMSAFVGNLLDPADSSPSAFEGEDFHNFDFAAVGIGFHHFEDPVLAATRLADRLKKGGVLLILDFLVDEKTGSKGNGNGFGQHGHGNGGGAIAKMGKRRGFGQDEMKLMFESACMGMDFGFEVIAKGAVFETPKHSMAKDVFMARGTKA